MVKTILVMLRHGESYWNRAKKIQGQADIPLNKNGIFQAEASADFLYNNDCKGLVFNSIYSSDLSRARQTALRISDKLNVSIKFDENLRERACGDFEGLTVRKIEKMFPSDYLKWTNQNELFKPSGKSESKKEFYNRVIKVINIIKEKNYCKKVLVVTHGGVLECVYRYINRIPLEEVRNFPILNASFNKVSFDFEKGIWSVDSWGDVGHLKGQGVLDSGVGDSN